MLDIKSCSIDELSEFIVKNGFEKYRASQINKWLNKPVYTFNEMNNLPVKLIDFLAGNSYISQAKIIRKQTSKIDKTIKYLFQFNDFECVESVVMSYHHGYTICISTQVGCKMGCTFCATGKSGFSRSLTPSEMISQIQAAQDDLNIRISNVVLMGMGEPLDNYDNVVKFLRLVSSKDNLNIGMRHITLSTCGIVPKIFDLADLDFQITLSISLHAPNNILRSETMPINKKYDIEQLINACKYYINKTNRRISFEYALINGKNDSDKCANELSKLLYGMLCHVNLIPVNNVKDTTYTKSNINRQERFKSILENNHINVTIRRTLGSDIDASCGQLRRKFKEGEN